MKLRYQLITLFSFLLLTFSLANPALAEEGSHEISVLPVNPDTEIPEKAHHITFYGSPGPYYLDKSDQFLMDFHHLDKKMEGIDSVIVTIGDDNYYFSTLTPYLISGLAAHETTVKVKLRGGGEDIKFAHHEKGKVKFNVYKKTPLVSSDAVLLGMVMILLALIFKTASSPQPFFQKFYKVVPSLLLCYFLPSLLTTFNIANPGESKLYYVASRFLLPASLVLLTLSIDLKEILKLGPKALIMFFTGTIGVVLGGPLAILIFSYLAPDVVGGEGPEAVWRGMTTVAGSWIGGGANQAAMYEIFEPSDAIYSVMITVDIVVAEIWMAFLLLGVGRAAAIDRIFKADASAVIQLRDKMHEFTQRIARIPSFTDLMIILGFALGATGLAHFIANWIAPYIAENMPMLKKLSLGSSFFWLIVLSTSFGLALSFTKARSLEGAGASRVGSIFIYFLVATIGMKMNILEIFAHPGLFLVGGVWMLFHVVLLLIVGKLIKAPYFFLAVGSKANIGGAASAPVVAAAFHPSLAPVGVLLAVLGYALGTYGAWLCGLLMEMVSP